MSAALRRAPVSAEIDAELARAARQEMAAADIGEEADARLRHRHHGALGHDARARR